ncbi:MAG: hypothetical protein K9N51_11810 [Candidatus Pacebacteria bacterium]|nr:hypothetical protein [Candidatus Paceibacterota bacterium]
MTECAKYEQLRTEFVTLLELNPYEAVPHTGKLYRLSHEVQPSCFPDFAELTEQLIETYLNSRIKTAEYTIMGEFHEYVEHACRRLAEHGEITHAATSETDASEGFALVRPYSFSALEWLRIMNRSGIPEGTLDAVDAVTERHRQTSSVLEVAFNVLHRIDCLNAFQWEFAYLRSKRGTLDVDVVRDLLRTWRCQNTLPEEALRWAREWSNNINVQRLWPAVTQEADAVLRLAGLRAWRGSATGRQSCLMHLRLLMEKRRHTDTACHHWLDTAVTEVGNRIDSFMSITRGLPRETNSQRKERRRNAATRELVCIEQLFLPILVQADLMLGMPAGPYRFALALLGISQRELAEWREKLEEQAATIIRRLLIENLKHDSAPLDTIRRFCLGDDVLFQRLANQLDLLTKHFDSVEQREKTVSELAVNYASYRESEMLGKELTKRYRHLMRTLHVDNLRRLLGDQQFEAMQDADTLSDLSALAGHARRFLNRRRDLETSVEDMLSAETEFCQSIRTSRLHVIQAFVGGKTSVS